MGGGWRERGGRGEETEGREGRIGTSNASYWTLCQTCNCNSCKPGNRKSYISNLVLEDIQNTFNSTNKPGKFSPLHWAAFAGHFEMVYKIFLVDFNRESIWASKCLQYEKLRQNWAKNVFSKNPPCNLLIFEKHLWFLRITDGKFERYNASEKNTKFETQIVSR